MTHIFGDLGPLILHFQRHAAQRSAWPLHNLHYALRNHDNVFVLLAIFMNGTRDAFTDICEERIHKTVITLRTDLKYRR